MKKALLFLALIASGVQSQTIDLKAGSTIDIENTSVNIQTDLTTQEVSSALGINPPDSSIVYFNGPCGSDNCTVSPNTPFNMHWEVENVAQCTGSNTYKHQSFNGTVEPLGGGSGTFQKTIAGGLPANAGTVTFTLTCPAPVTQSFNVKLKRIEKTEIYLPNDTRFMIYVHNKELMLINVVENNVKTPVIKPVQALQNNTYYTEVETNDRKSLKLNIKFETEKLSVDEKVWLFISEEDPEQTGNYKPEDVGVCDTFSNEPRINISTYSILKEKNKLNELCSIKPNTKYYLTRAYFKRVFNEKDLKKILELKKGQG